MNNNTGFIAIHRQLLEWKYHQNPSAMTLWVHLLLMANWKDGYFKGELIPRGSLATSLPSLAEETGLSESTIRRWLKRFENDGQIVTNVNSQFRVIKVANYADFQEISPQGVNSQVNSRLTPNRINKQGNKETNIRERVERESQLSSPSLPPTLRDISDFVGEEGLNVDPPKFWKYYNEWGKPFPADWKTRCRRWSETEHVRGQSQQNIVIEGPEWLKYTDVEIDKDKIDF